MWKTGIIGTSAATPSFAALVSLLNEKQLQQGRPRLGFLNPWLYSLESSSGAFTDVTQGTNAIGFPSGAIHGPLPYGFNATIGWDPVSGLGTPNFGQLVDLLPH